MMRTLLYEAAQTLLTRVTKWSWLKAWTMNVAKRRGQQKAVFALARRLAVIMHRIWRDGTQFRWTRTEIMPVAGCPRPDQRQHAAVLVPVKGQVAARWVLRSPPLTITARGGKRRSKGRDEDEGDGRPIGRTRR
ncbi:hypothetical protein [Mesorhizobium sp. M0400]|uniref:hypothetical protein n=1 Tax=Mesorhizobium sp. M0400 TaxID=2956941 RepID=UPI0033388DE4